METVLLLSEGEVDTKKGNRSRTFSTTVCWKPKGSEIDYVLQSGMEIIPIEAKGGEDKSVPSFKRYIADKKPEHAFHFSKRGYSKDGDFTNLPLYLARKTKDLL